MSVTSRSGCGACCTSCRTSRSTPRACRSTQLAKMIGAERDELLADLDLLSQVGPPDGDPGEYLLVSVDEGRVFVDLAHRLTRPLRLTPAEGCSLLLGIRALRESGIAPFDAAMQSAEKKLLTALGRDASEAQSLATVDGRRASPDAAVATHLRTLVTAARKRQRVEIDYVVGVAPPGRAPPGRSVRHRPPRRRVVRRRLLPQARRRPHVPHRSHRRARAHRRAVRAPGRLRPRGLPPRAALRAERRRRHRPRPARPARGHPDRRELARRRSHDAGRRLRRAARSTARASSGSPAGCSASAATPGSSAPPRRGPRCASGSTACVPMLRRPESSSDARSE